jgi:CRISPR-associated protein Cas5t
LGDNAFILDRLELVAEPGPVRWFEKITPESDVGIRPQATRLTVLIDRADLSRTTSALFAPQEHAVTGDPPLLAWNLMNPPGHDIPEPPAGRPNHKKSN